MAKTVVPLSGACYSCRRALLRSATSQYLPIRFYANASENIIPHSDPPPPPPPKQDIDPRTVTSPALEKQLLRAHRFPIGSRRRRAALQSSKNIPFEALPYQCFQEARQVLQDDRAEKLVEIEQERRRIQTLLAQETAGPHEEWKRQNRLRSMRRHLDYLKIQADSNDPLVKRKFEDGKGDLNRPIYRHLLERKWRSAGGKYMILNQRIEQMNVVPDILPSIDLTADCQIHFHGTKPHSSKTVIPRPEYSRRSSDTGLVAVQPGEFVASAVSEVPPALDVQVFDKGERLVSIAVVDPDVPNLETDSFDYRCHFLAVNIPVSPTQTRIDLSKLDKDGQVLLDWFPPTAQKGSPYHRLAVLVFEQPVREYNAAKEVEEAKKANKLSTANEIPAVAETTKTAAPGLTPDAADTTAEKASESTQNTTNTEASDELLTTASHTPAKTTTTIPPTLARQKVHRANFITRAFADRHNLHPITATLFRIQHDEWMDSVMLRHGVEGAGQELRVKRGEKLPYKKKEGFRFRGQGAGVGGWRG